MFAKKGDMIIKKFFQRLNHFDRYFNYYLYLGDIKGEILKGMKKRFLKVKKLWIKIREKKHDLDNYEILRLLFINMMRRYIGIKK